jgi:hypothetical protein
VLFCPCAGTVADVHFLQNAPQVRLRFAIESALLWARKSREDFDSRDFSGQREGFLRARANHGIILPSSVAEVAKLADAPDLGSGGEILRGSSPLLGK